MEETRGSAGRVVSLEVEGDTSLRIDQLDCARHWQGVEIRPLTGIHRSQVARIDVRIDFAEPVNGEPFVKLAIFVG